MSSSNRPRQKIGTSYFLGEHPEWSDHHQWLNTECVHPLKMLPAEYCGKTSGMYKAGCTALQRAAAEGHLDVVKQLIKHGANVNIQDKVHGNTALHEASWRGFSKCVEALCKANKVNLQVKNAGGFAPLHLACQKGHNQSCRELLMANCNPDIQNNYGDTPLHTSARYGHAGVTRILISADCHMSDQNKNGDTALHITAAMGRRKLTRILLEAGCDPNRRNKQNERAKDIAIRKDLNEIIEIIDKTVPIKRKERQKEGKEKEKNKDKSKENDKKRGKNESGSSKDSSTRPKDKKKAKNDHQVRFENVETKWSPYGCHYYPDSKTFPKPKLDSLPHEPLKKGEQYFLDLAGNIKKGPVGVGYTCYCAPFFRHMEERLDRDKRELKEHIDAAQIRLDRKVTSLEVKTRSQLNEITRSMALERAKCQQRHLHLEQWLIRGSIFRNSEKPKPSDFSQTPLPKSRSLENILEEKQLPGENLRRSVDILNDCTEPRKDENDDLKNRSSSREGKESGKGSSEIGDIGTSDGEDKIDESADKIGPFTKRLTSLEKQEQRIRRRTREISEKIDQVAVSEDTVDGLGLLYDEMLKWKSYQSAYSDRNRKSEKENQRISSEVQVFKRPVPQDRSRHVENRRSYHDLLKDHDPDVNEKADETRARRLSDPRGTVEEPSRKSVQEIVTKLQKQHTVQELVAKIQKKTGLIHKSAQKWKESKLKEKESQEVKKVEKKENSESSQGETGKPEKMLHNYENIRQWDVPQEKLSQLPYRCRNTVYSPSPTHPTYDPQEYQRNMYSTNRDFTEGTKRSNFDAHNYSPCFSKNAYQPEIDRRDGYGHNMRHDPYGYTRPAASVYQEQIKVDIDPRRMVKSGQNHHDYSPTQNDSGYSTKHYGGSSTGPSPSLSGSGSAEMKPAALPLPIHKTLEGTTSSLV